MKRFSKNILIVFMVPLLAGWTTYPVNPEHETIVSEILQKSKEVLSNSDFQEILSQIEDTEFDHLVDDDDSKEDDGRDVIKKLEANQISGIVCRKSKNPFNTWTNAWEGGGVPQLRCSKFGGKRTTPQWVGTILHEQAHAAGYSHKEKGRKGSQCSVPVIVGDLATFILDYQEGKAKIKKDTCPSLKTKLEQKMG